MDLHEIYSGVERGELLNLAYPSLGHIAEPSDAPRRDIDLSTAAEKYMESLGLGSGWRASAVPSPREAIEAVASLLPRGRTAYALPWHTEAEKALKRIYKPLVSIPVDGADPIPSFLDYNFEYDGLYYIETPDRTTGKTYLDLLAKIVETLVDKAGLILIDITYLHTIPIEERRAVARLLSIEEVWAAYLARLPESLTRHDYTAPILIHRIDGLDVEQAPPPIARSTASDLIYQTSLWDGLIDTVSETIGLRKEVLREIGIEAWGASVTIEVEDPGDAELIARSRGVVLRRVDSIRRIGMSLYTRTDFPKAVEKIRDVLEARP